MREPGVDHDDLVERLLSTRGEVLASTERGKMARDDCGGECTRCAKARGIVSLNVVPASEVRSTEISPL